MLRLLYAFDSITSEFLYHYLCLLNKFDIQSMVNNHLPVSNKKHHNRIKNAVKQQSKEIDYRLCQWKALLIYAYWERFEELCGSRDVSIPFYLRSKLRYFKYKLSKLLPNIPIIPRQEVNCDDDIGISSSLTYAEAHHVFNEQNIDDDEFKLPAYNESEMVGLYVVLYLTIAYKQCLQAYSTLAEDTLWNVARDTDANVPSNLTYGRLVQFGQDNIDCSTESAIVGHSAGYYGTQIVAYQQDMSKKLRCHRLCSQNRL